MATVEVDEFELDEHQSERFALLTRNLQEVLGEQQIRKHLRNNKNIHVYWGTAITGRPHVGYFVPMQKISDFLKAGIRVTILFADLHGFLDNLKSTFEMLENRVLYYEHVIKALLHAFDVPLDRLSFVKGTDYQFTENYTQDVLRLCGQVSQRDALRAGAEVVKQVGDPLLSGLMYPLLQALDEQYLKVDGQFGGVDQRKIFILAEEQLPKLKLGKRYHLMNPMVPGLTGTKMSSSEENTKIDLLDPPDVVTRKIQGADCAKTEENGQNSACTQTGGIGADNGVLAFFKYVVFPTRGSIKFNNNMEFGAATELINAFNEDRVTEQQLKDFLSSFLNEVLGKVQSDSESTEIKTILAKAYAVETLGDQAEPMAPELDEEGKKFLDTLRQNSEIIESPRLLERINAKKPIRVVWRLSAKGRFHLGYLKPLMELRRLKRLGCQCFVVLSDLGGFLDGEKCPWNARSSRLDYYDTVLRGFLKILDLADIPVKHSSEHQFKREYTINMYKCVSKVTRDESSLTPSSQENGHTLACHLSPIYHCLDVHYVDADLQLIGENQKEFVKLAGKLAECCHFPKQAAIVHDIIDGMNGEKMSSTCAEFQLDPIDTPKQIKTKIARSFCEPGNLRKHAEKLDSVKSKKNVAIQWAEDVIFPLDDFKTQVIERTVENGGNLEVRTADELDELFAAEKLHPADLKAFVVQKLNNFLEPIRASTSAESLSKLLSAAFPSSKSGGKKK